LSRFFNVSSPTFLGGTYPGVPSTTSSSIPLASAMLGA
jgi:hypothetical protein